MKEEYDRSGVFPNERSAEKSFKDKFGQVDLNEQDNKGLVSRFQADNVSHSDGFEQWMRSRSQTGVVTDATVQEIYGTSTSSYNAIPNPFCHPSLTILPTDLDNSNLSERVKNPASFLKRESQVLPSTLQWGEVLVQTLLAPICGQDVKYAILGSEDPSRSSDLDNGNEVSSMSTLAKFGGSSNSSGLDFASRLLMQQKNQSQPSSEKQIRAIGFTGLMEVVQTGPGVTLLKSGDWVIPLGQLNAGTWRTGSIIKSNQLLKIDRIKGLSEEAAALSLDIVTGFYLLEKYGSHLSAGDGIIINAPCSTVGITVIQLAKILGLRVICIVRRHPDENIRVEVFNEQKIHLLSLGASEVFYEDEDIRSSIERQGFALPVLALDGVSSQLSSTCLVSSLMHVSTAESKNLPPPTSVVYSTRGSKGLLSISTKVLLETGATIKTFNASHWLQSGVNQMKFAAILDHIASLQKSRNIQLFCKEFDASSTIEGNDVVAALEFHLTRGRLHRPLLHFPSLMDEQFSVKIAIEREYRAEQKSESSKSVLFSKKACDYLETGQSVPIGAGWEEVTGNGKAGVPVVKRSIIYLRDDSVSTSSVVSFFRNIFDDKSSDIQDCRVIIPYVNEINKSGGKTSWLGSSPLVNSIFADWVRQEKTENQSDSTPLLMKQNLDINEIEALHNLEMSCDLVCCVIGREVARGIDPRNIILVGNRDGALVALLTVLLKLDEPIGMAAAFSPPPLPRKIADDIIAARLIDGSKLSKVFLFTTSSSVVCPPSQLEKFKRLLIKKGIKASSEVIAKLPGISMGGNILNAPADGQRDPSEQHMIEQFGLEQMAHLQAVMSLIYI